MNLYSAAWYFMIYSAIGWGAEVSYAAVCHGRFVNRGFLCGPLCPIYGIGAILIIICLAPIAERLILLFLSSVILTSLLELVTGFVLEKYFHTKWWDYSEYPMNIGGYVCLKFSLLWGIACVLLVRVIHPIISSVVERIPRVAGMAVLSIFLVIFVSDVTVTFISLSGLRNYFRGIEDAQRIMRIMSDRIGATISDETVEIMSKNSGILRRINATYEAAGERLTVKRDELVNAIDYIYHNIDRNGWVYRRVMSAFPAIAERYRTAQNMLVEKLSAVRGALSGTASTENADSDKCTDNTVLTVCENCGKADISSGSEEQDDV